MIDLGCNVYLKRKSWEAQQMMQLELDVARYKLEKETSE